MGSFTGRARTFCIAATAALTIGVSGASAGSFTSSAATCAEQVYEQPFLPWLDPANYVLSPGGSFEGSLGGWTLAGARVVSGNEPYFVSSSADRLSLALPAGSSATSRPLCVSLLHPTLRFFVKSGGSLLSSLGVEVLFEDVFGAVRAAPIARVLAIGSRWQTTLPIPFLLNVTAPLSLDGSTIAVAFRFTAKGGPWTIDDVYVDPYKAT